MENFLGRVAGSEGAAERVQIRAYPQELSCNHRSIEFFLVPLREYLH